MKHRIALVVVLVVTFFAGCNSFNRVTYEVHPASNVRTMTISGLKEIVPASGSDVQIIKIPPVVRESPKPVVHEVIPKGWCPVFTFPKLPPEPPAPESKLEAMNPHDVSGIESLSADHIVELHNYIRHNQELLQQSYEIYLKECEKAHLKVKM
jgi:hypothetical protein